MCLREKKVLVKRNLSRTCGSKNAARRKFGKEEYENGRERTWKSDERKRVTRKTMTKAMKKRTN